MSVLSPVPTRVAAPSPRVTSASAPATRARWLRGAGMPSRPGHGASGPPARCRPAVVCNSAGEPIGQALAGALPGSAGASGGVVVRLSIHAQLGFGNGMAVVGAGDAFGAWAPERALPLTWTDGDMWTGEVALPAGAGPVEYKLIVSTGDGGFDWEGGENRVVQLDAAGMGGVLVVSGEFGGDVHVASLGADGVAVPQPPQRQQQQQHYDAPPPPPPAASPSSREWQGGQVNFIQHRDQDAENRAMQEAANRSRGGDNLKGASRLIADGDKRSTSWLQKLELINSLVGQGKDISLDNIAACGVYLRWISTGSIACVEDGQHHRPNRMAEVARDIFINLETVAGELYKHGPEVGEAERQVMRQLQPWLPSFSSEFTCSVPLTRIRDIAHRNDIPQDVKLEIKHSIQNKLHRNAGPEDLVSTELMLKRITVDAYPGQFNDDFVNEFTIFHKELKRFFNCAGALERVDALRDSVEEEAKGMIDELQGAMWALDGGEAGHDGMLGREGQAVLRALRAATAVRSHITRALSTGMRNDAPNESVVQRQAWRLAEISLEELAFVVMARAAACSGAGVEGEGDGSAHFSGVLNSAGTEESRAMWACSCEAAAQGLRQMALSMWRPAECNAAASEIEAWCQAGAAAGGPISTTEDALRMRASLQRSQRLIEAHTEALIEGYGESPSGLGDAFGLPSHVGSTFVDSIIRAGVPFQLSRLITPMLRATSNAAGLGAGGYDAIVLGDGVGRLVECDRLEPGAVGDAADGPVIALVWGADGDEEVSAAGRHVRGVILARDLPHLSHLAIRARQEKVPLTATEDKDAHLAAKYLLGQQVILRVTANGVSLAPATETDVATAAGGAADAAAAAAAAAPVQMTPVELSDVMECRPLSEATLAQCGAKATTCGDLTRVAERPNSGFKAPAGVFLPFGAMEACLRGAGKADALVELVAATETAAAGGDPAAIEAACLAVRQLVAGAPFPPELAAQLTAAFPDPNGAARVVVRSSANVEDLAGMSAAGLYESVLGVSASSAAELGDAVREVWASLYSRRAVLARRAAGVPQASAHMAVLVQEMAPSRVSFVLHTATTSGASAAAAGPTSATLEAEVAVGLGETLASGARGSPWRLEVDQATGIVRTTAFASFGSALMIRKHAAHLGVQAEAVDYSQQELSTDVTARMALGRRLAAVGAALEAEYGAPQDIEGGVVGDVIYIVQSRPQPM